MRSKTGRLVQIWIYKSATCPFILDMATTNDDFVLGEDSDTESIFSIITDDGEDHLPERILAEYTRIGSLTWYLVKWKNCPLLRSSWENIQSIQAYAAV